MELRPKPTLTKEKEDEGRWSSTIDTNLKTKSPRKPARYSGAIDHET